MPLRYAVKTCPNNPNGAAHEVKLAADNGGRGPNVIWQQDHASTITIPTMPRA
ncbi:hypothetical protein [Mesorhizobium sp. ORS 3428]|uniref:hypothetical protein n=1 Tax=Mesorhizobium sp. ORS 3428 TaxID=540997 RepID=UPI0012FF8C78|nr:hypothetical protein [Mesorhizobium sp. ORS 3428]